MVQIELFHVLVVSFVISLMVLEILFDITILISQQGREKINTIIMSPFFMNLSRHFIFFTESATNIAPKYHGLKPRGFHSPFSELSLSIITVVLFASTVSAMML